MKSRPGLLFEFGDGREIAVPFPSARRMAAVFALTPAPGSPETESQFVQRFIRQVDTLLESARWISVPATTRATATTTITGASFTLSEARQFTNAVLAHYFGSDARAFTRGVEIGVAAAGHADLQHVSLGTMLEMFRRHSL